MCAKIFVQKHRTTEWAYTSPVKRKNPFTEINLDALVTTPSGRIMRIPAFYGGDNVWRLRFSSSELGTHPFQTQCSDTSDTALHGQTGSIEVSEYEGNNPLFKHGPLRVSTNRGYLEHEDGTPFLWLADTWWMGFSKRLNWPNDFQMMAQDRIKKGFNVIQIVAGLYPDMPAFDPRGDGDAGQAWEQDYSAIRPEYFDTAEPRLLWLIEQGITPCIVGCWAYHIAFAGDETLKRHWRYLIARWGSYPVVWCSAGEVSMPYYTSPDWGTMQDYAIQIKPRWSAITRYVKETDPFKRALTAHPPGEKAGRDTVDEGLLDFNFLQTGHADRLSFPPAMQTLHTSLQQEPRMPVLNSESCYEGIISRNWHDVQRLMFWNCMLSGACGHTYGANGIWQVNSVDHPYGESPTGNTWGDTPWQEAYQLPGSGQMGLGKRFLERFEWWRFEPHNEWVQPCATPEAPEAPIAAGIPGKIRIIYKPALSGITKITGIEPNVSYRAYYFNPINGTEKSVGDVQADSNGDWTPPNPSVFHDWVLVLESK